jgi:hypothetical protein
MVRIKEEQLEQQDEEATHRAKYVYEHDTEKAPQMVVGGTWTFGGDGIVVRVVVGSGFVVVGPVFGIVVLTVVVRLVVHCGRVRVVVGSGFVVVGPVFGIVLLAVVVRLVVHGGRICCCCDSGFPCYCYP